MRLSARCHTQESARQKPRSKDAKDNKDCRTNGDHVIDCTEYEHGEAAS